MSGRVFQLILEDNKAQECQLTLDVFSLGSLWVEPSIFNGFGCNRNDSQTQLGTPCVLLIEVCRYSCRIAKTYDLLRLALDESSVVFLVTDFADDAHASQFGSEFKAVLDLDLIAFTLWTFGRAEHIQAAPTLL